MPKVNLDLIIETEKKLLAALMLHGGEAIPSVAAELTADDFYRPEHRLIYEALLQLSDDNTPLDISVVEKQLYKNGTADKVTHPYLFSLLPMEYTTLRCEVYTATIKEASTYRKLASVGKYLEHMADSEEIPLDKLLVEVEKQITAAVRENFKAGVTPASKFFLDEYLSLGKKSAPGLKTGFHFVDLVTGGLKPSELIILAARPSMGKTALALNFAVNISKKHSVLLFSLEMGKTQLAERMFAADSGLSSLKIQHRTFTPQQYGGMLQDSMERLTARKLFIDDGMETTLVEVKMKSRRVQREHGLDLIIIDYLQLMKDSGRYKDNRVQAVSELSRGLKALARELNIPILALSQLSREVEKRADKHPLLSDLRESGSIEQDADIVMFLYRDEYYNKETEKQGIAELIVAKNRNGATDTVPLQFNRDTQLFSDLTREG